MKLSILPLLIAGAGIAQHVSASPIRIVVTEVSSNLRFGHAVANAKNDNLDVAHVAVAPPFVEATITQVDDAGRQRKPHRKCSGMRSKAIAISNTFRKALGFPLIEVHTHASTKGGKEIQDGIIRILPMPFVGTSVNEAVQGEGQEMKPHRPEHHEHHGQHHGKHHGKHSHKSKHRCGSFMRRIHNALKALGPWEGRAVAFVIGCGIGVLLRMVWVLGLVTYRAIRGERDAETEYSEIVFEHDGEEFMVPPPRYNDEKVEVVDNKPPTA